MTPHAAKTLTAKTLTAKTLIGPKPGPAPLRTGLVATVMSPFHGFVGIITQELRLRHDVRLLAEMDDVQLSDIGVKRTQIADAVRTGRVSPWLDRR